MPKEDKQMTARSLEGKTALLTGAVRRNGRAAALALAKDGANIVLNCRKSVDEGNAVVREIEAEGGRAILIKADITKESEVNDMMALAVRTFGGLDILVSNAADRKQTPLLEMSFEEWQRITRIVIDGAFLCARAAIPHMLKAGGGTIVTLGGISTYVGTPDRAHVCTAKAGLVGFTRAIAQEFGARGIRANCVSPGRIGGPRAASAGELPGSLGENGPPVGRDGYCEEIGEAVRWLCQPSQGFVNGMTLHVNGGQFMP